LIGEKLLAFVMASERDPEFAAELPAFVAEIRRLFAPGSAPSILLHPNRRGSLPGELSGSE
jgi:hypothetical protein